MVQSTSLSNKYLNRRKEVVYCQDRFSRVPVVGIGCLFGLCSRKKGVGMGLDMWRDCPESDEKGILY